MSHPEPNISLTNEQAELCCFMLRRDLVRVSGLLASNKDAAGQDLSELTQDGLTALSSSLQETLIAFGITDEEVNRILKG